MEKSSAKIFIHVVMFRCNVSYNAFSKFVYLRRFYKDFVLAFINNDIETIFTFVQIVSTSFIPNTTVFPCGPKFAVGNYILYKPLKCIFSKCFVKCTIPFFYIANKPFSNDFLYLLNKCEQYK